MTTKGWCGCVAVLVSLLIAGNAVGKLIASIPLVGPTICGLFIIAGTVWIVCAVIVLTKEEVKR